MMTSTKNKEFDVKVDGRNDSDKIIVYDLTMKVVDVAFRGFYEGNFQTLLSILRSHETDIRRFWRTARESAKSR